MNKIITIAQASILILHFALIMHYKSDRNKAVENLNERIENLNVKIKSEGEMIGEVNKGFKEITSKLDSLNKHKPCFK